MAKEKEVLDSPLEWPIPRRQERRVVARREIHGSTASTRRLKRWRIESLRLRCVALKVKKGYLDCFTGWNPRHPQFSSRNPGYLIRRGFRSSDLMIWVPKEALEAAIADSHWDWFDQSSKHFWYSSSFRGSVWLKTHRR